MKNYSKSILLILIIGLISISVIACRDDAIDYSNIKGSMGLLEDLRENDDNLEVVFKLPNEEMLKLNASKDFLTELLVGKDYTFAYNKDTDQIIQFETIEVKENSNVKDKDGVSQENKSIPLTKGRLDVEELTLADTVETVVTNPDREDNINLYTSAGRDDSGELMLDDGQEWKLIVHTEEGDYLLFDDYVQGKPLGLYVFTEDEDLRIVTLQSGTANLNLNEYRYDRESKTFTLTEKYEAIDNINMIYNN